ncbi:unnamed protein product [Cochlearia groenlandica]
MNSRNFVLLLLISLIFLHDASGITHADHAQVHPLHTRKMMMKDDNLGGVNGEKKTMVLGFSEELRTVPSGPDPMHHHMNPPRQPRSDSNLP